VRTLNFDWLPRLVSYRSVFTRPNHRVRLVHSMMQFVTQCMPVLYNIFRVYESSELKQHGPDKDPLDVRQLCRPIWDRILWNELIE
jgi:hypothetical protein